MGNFGYSAKQRYHILISFTVCTTGLCFVPFASKFLTALLFKICSENLCYIKVMLGSGHVMVNPVSKDWFKTLHR